MEKDVQKEQVPLAVMEAKPKAEAPAPKAEKVVVLPGNCAGELEALPGVEGVTHTQYKCKVCGQIVYVGHEHLAEYGLPTQHAKPEEDK